MRPWQARLLVFGTLVGFYLEPAAILWLDATPAPRAPASPLAAGLAPWYEALATDDAHRALALAFHILFHLHAWYRGGLDARWCVPLLLLSLGSVAANTLCALPAPADPVTSHHIAVEVLLAPVVPGLHTVAAPRLTWSLLCLVRWLRGSPKPRRVLVVVLMCLDALLLLATRTCEGVVLLLSFAAAAPFLSLTLEEEEPVKKLPPPPAPYTIDDEYVVHTDDDDERDEFFPAPQKQQQQQQRQPDHCEAGNHCIGDGCCETRSIGVLSTVSLDVPDQVEADMRGDGDGEDDLP